MLPGVSYISLIQGYRKIFILPRIKKLIYNIWYWHCKDLDVQSIHADISVQPYEELMELMELLEMENLDKRWLKWKSNATYWFGIYTECDREDWLVNVKMKHFGEKRFRYF